MNESVVVDIDLNPQNYDVKELVSILDLGDSYTRKDIHNRGSIMREQIMKSSIGPNEQTTALLFIANAETRILDEMMMNTQQQQQQQINQITRTLLQNTSAVETFTPILRRIDPTTNDIHSFSVGTAPHFPQQYENFILNNKNKIVNNDDLNIKRIYLSFNSIFRDSNSTSITDAIYTLPYKITNVLSMSLLSVELPNTIYLFSGKYKDSSFDVSINIPGPPPPPPPPQPCCYECGNCGCSSCGGGDGGGGGTDNITITKTILIPEGNYCPHTLATLLTNLLNAAFSTPSTPVTSFMVVSDDATGKITVSNTTPFSLQFVTPRTSQNVIYNVGWLLGYRLPVYKGTMQYKSESIYNPSPFSTCYFSVDEYNGDRAISSFLLLNGSSGNFQDDTVLAKIRYTSSMSCCNCSTSCNTNCSTSCANSYTTFFDGLLDIIATHRSYVGPIDISKIRVMLLDNYGNVINLQESNYGFTLQINVQYNS